MTKIIIIHRFVRINQNCALERKNLINSSWNPSCEMVARFQITIGIKSQLYQPSLFLHKDPPPLDYPIKSLRWIIETPKEGGKRVPMTHCLPIFPSPRAIYPVGLHIFNHFFLSNPALVRYFLSPSFPSVSLFRPTSTACMTVSMRTRTRYTPKTGYFWQEKRTKKARIRYTREGRSTKRANGA